MGIMNIRVCALLLAGCCLLAVGCQRQAAIPSDSFRLTVERIFTDHDYEISLVKVNVSHTQNTYISISNQFSHGTIFLANSPNDTPGDGEIALVASRFTQPGGKSYVVQTLIRPKSVGSYTGSRGSFTDTGDSPLETYLSVSLTNGDFKLDAPMEICRLDGKPVTMVVGKPVN
jgi:hypothetical protein